MIRFILLVPRYTDEIKKPARFSRLGDRSRLQTSISTREKDAYKVHPNGFNQFKDGALKQCVAHDHYILGTIDPGQTMKPKLFIGSSAEQLPLAKAVQVNLHHAFDTTIWTQGIFSATKTALDSLQEHAGRFDFAVFIFAPDDILKLRDKKYEAVRDNVLFELGLFIGLLGKDRNFCLAPKKREIDLRVASDLIGFIPIIFDDDPHEKNKVKVLGPACNEMEQAVDSIWTDSFLGGDWMQTWHLNGSSNFDKANPSKATVQHKGNRFKTVIQSKSQRFEVNGKVQRDMFITGTWSDELQGASYFGSFQLSIAPQHDKLLGKWLGFNHTNKIKSGKWEWIRIKSKKT